MERDAKFVFNDREKLEKVIGEKLRNRSGNPAFMRFRREEQNIGIRILETDGIRIKIFFERK
jgi:hypothetical protein